MKSAGIILAVVIIVVAIFVVVSLASTGTGNSVEMLGFFFHPRTLTVSQGATVVWTNKDFVNHTVIGQGWGSGNLGRNGTYSHTFAQTGTFDYHCSHHFWMKGRVIVK